MNTQPGMGERSTPTPTLIRQTRPPACLPGAALPRAIERFPWLVLLLLVSLGGSNLTSAWAGTPPPEGEAVRLHPDLDKILSAETAAQFGLFAELDGLQEITFLKAPWGGYIARLRIETSEGMVWRERNVPTSTWRQWQVRVARVLAGQENSVDLTDSSDSVDREDATQMAALSPDRIRVWPEVPLPPFVERPPPGGVASSDYQDLSGRWFVLLEAGMRRNVTEFNSFFTDMGMIAMNWGRMFGRLMPYMSMEVGFGDLPDDFEELAGDGRSNTYGFSLGLLARQPLGRRNQFYVSGAFGYYIRSLQWGGTFVNTTTGSYADGLVLEQQNWGWSFRAGLMFNRKHTHKSRFWDVGVGLQTTPAEEWHYFDEINDFFASERDMWITLSIRFGDSI